jgi:GMP synthase (glutamine-hydrolysing)
MLKHILILRHIAHEPAGTIEHALTKAGLEFRYFDLFAKKSLNFNINKVSGLVIMGGPMSVNSVRKYPYLVYEAKWIRQAIDLGIPLLGVCLGAQLIAKAMGARVYPNGIKEIGWYSVELTPAAAEDRLFAGCGPELTVFQWHGDTFDLPPGAVHLAQSTLCRNQAFRIGPTAYGLQFHIEMTAEMIEDWLTVSENAKELAKVDYIDPDDIRQKTPIELPAMQVLAEKVIGRFAALCLEKGQ